MLPSRGKNSGEPKKWVRRIHCCYGTCESNTRDIDVDVKLLPFPKPCPNYISSLVNKFVKHDIKTCIACTKCTRWIHLCKRGDNNLRVLTDITSKTYICSKHFFEPSGPTVNHPDPYPADKSVQSLVHERSRARKRPAERHEQPRAKARRNGRSGGSVMNAKSGENEDEQCSLSFINNVNIDDQPIACPVSQPILDHSIDHSYAQNQTEDTSAFEKLALDIFKQNLQVQFDHEVITVTVHKGVSCLIDRSYRISFEVYSNIVDNNHVIWAHVPRQLDPTFPDTTFLKTVREQWRACKCAVNSYAASEFINKLGSSTGIDIDLANDAINQSLDCKQLCRLEVCNLCKQKIASIAKKQKRKVGINGASKNIRFLNRGEALECVRETRRTLKLQKRKTTRLRTKLERLIQSKGTKLTLSDNEDFLNILSSSKESPSKCHESGECTEAGARPPKKKIDMTKLFFEEQLKVAKAKTAKGRRWHPLMLKWCLYLKTKSSSTYSALKKVITLPSEKRLYEIQYHTHVRPGFQPDVTLSLVKEFEDAGSENHKRYCSLMYDEMKIQEDLVYKAFTNELIGFVRLSDVDQLLDEIESELSGAGRNEEKLASHVLQIMVRGITTSILTTFAYFATRTLTSKNLYTILWEAVEILERHDIRVLTFVSDGAAANRSFYARMISKSSKPQTVQYSTINPYSRDRNIYFICDVPHLAKTTRNCFSNSGAHAKTRLLWKNNKHIEWGHVIQAYKSDISDGIRKLSHITDEHVYLTPCSRMKVKLAVQILSRRMANAVAALHHDEMSETVLFLETFNNWFDMLNTRHLKEATRSRNPNLRPYTSEEDCRLAWMTGGFIEYLDNWEKEVMDRPGDFTKSQRHKMLLSRETIEGLKITAHSVSAVTKFMLSEGAPFILTYKFNQDPVELEFSKQRGAAGCNTNPNLMRFGDNTAKLKSMRMAKQELSYSGKGNCTL